jgi:His-Xaa-Ser system radical SAM maturase HxsC
MTDWPLTFRCNNNCISCINNTNIFYRRLEPPLKQIKDVIDKINPKNDYLGLSGGEPTLRKELFDILEYARETHPGLYIFVVSNGRMFCYRNFAKKLADLNLKNFMIGITLYGHSAKLHDFITRTKGSFEQAVSGIRNLLDFCIPVELRTVINRFNYKYLPQIADFVAKQFPEIDRMVFINMKFTGNAYINRDSILVRISDIVPYAEKAAEILENSEIETRLYHFPLCVLPKKLWNIAKGVTKHEKHDLTFVRACEKCWMRNKCPKIWKSYAYIVGDKEFRAIT